MSITRLIDRLGHSKSGTVLSNIRLDSPEIRSAFPDNLLARWFHCCRRLDSAGYGNVVLSAYVRYAPKIAQSLDTRAAFDLTDSISEVAAKTGRVEAERLPYAAHVAADRIKDYRGFRVWLSLIERFAAIAPESTAALLERMEHLLKNLTIGGLESWVLAGIRSSGGDKEQRLRFFSFEDPESSRWLLYESGSVTFSSMAKRLGPFLRALWRVAPPMREPPLNATDQAKRRSSFDHGVIRMPTSFPGFHGAHAEDLYRACIAHIGAHICYSGPRFPVRKLKPIQIAVISLLEDARVESLAMREFPGLKRLWLPLHVAQTPSSLSPNNALMAPNMLARLARALIDPEFEDFDGWVMKARTEFFDRENDWRNPEISRELGGLLGNELGQMRVGWQFDMRNYVVEPPYRDDNMGVWDFGDDDLPQDSLEAEQLFDSIKIEQQPDDANDPADRERKEPEQDQELGETPVRIEIQQVEGIPVARYPEFDYLTGKERPEWATIVEYSPAKGPIQRIDAIVEEHDDVLHRITSLIDAARVSRPKRARRLADGDYLDLDACIEARIDQRMGNMPDPRVYGKWTRQDRDLSVLLLLDISESTRDKVVRSKVSVLDLEISASVLLAHAMSQLGDPFAIAAFCSNNRDDVRYYRIKDFHQPYNESVYSRLAGLESGLSTRIGAAIRHSGNNLIAQQSYRKLLLIITDGEPSDLDVDDTSYLIEDARKAVQSLAHQGVDVFGVGLQTGGKSYLEKIFGRRNSIEINRVDLLPKKLPMLYLRMTA